MLTAEQRAAARVVLDGLIRSGGAASGIEPRFNFKEREGDGPERFDPVIEEGFRRGIELQGRVSRILIQGRKQAV